MGKRNNNGLLSGNYLIADYNDTIFNNDLAVRVGVQKAIVLQSVHSAAEGAELAATQGYTDGFAFGRWWDVTHWEEMGSRFPYWSLDVVKNLVGELVDEAVLLKVAVDGKLYLAVDYDALEILMNEGE